MESMEQNMISTKVHTAGAAYVVGTHEQERTRIAKKLFLENFEKYRGVVSAACDKTNIDRRTFYNWKDEDPVFAAALKEVTAKTNDNVEDVLMGKILIERDGPSARYYLDRRHPLYKPRTEQTVVIVGEKTLEDLIDESRAKEEKNEGTDQHTTAAGGAAQADGAVVDPGQAGADGPVPAEPGAAPVLG